MEIIIIRTINLVKNNLRFLLFKSTNMVNKKAIGIKINANIKNR